MKIRIYDDSVRLRLDRSEVYSIGRNAAVECHTHFPGGGVFTYRLTVGPTDRVAASVVDCCIEVQIPRAVAQHWALDESQVSIRAEESIPGGKLALLIEKDFECLDPRAGEDQGNRFRNPKAAI